MNMSLEREYFYLYFDLSFIKNGVKSIIMYFLKIIMEWNKNEILEAIKPNILERLKAPLTAIFCSPMNLYLKKNAMVEIGK